MKKGLIIFLFCLCYTFSALSQSDTVVIRMNNFESKNWAPPSPKVNPHPNRVVAKGKGGPGFIDSIRVLNHSIGYDTNQYHLIVYTIDSVKALEGNFFGTFLNGKIILYDRFGRILSEKEFEYREADKANSSPYSYPVGTHRTHTYKNYKSKSPETVREVIYEKDSKRFVSRLYGSNGEIVSEISSKR